MHSLYMPQTSEWNSLGSAKLCSGGVPFYLGGGESLHLYRREKHGYHPFRMFCISLPHTNHVYVKTGISQGIMRTVVFN